MRHFCKIIRLPSGDNGIEIVDTPPKCLEPLPLPEVDFDSLPPHVRANMELNYELTCEFNNRGREYRNSHPQGNSFIARKRFYETLSKDREQVRREYFAELRDAVAGIEARLPEAVPVGEPTYEDVIRSFGGRFTGVSQVMRQRNKRTVLVGEL